MLDQKILQYFENKKVLITGGTGMLGRQVVDILANTGAQITIVSLDDINVSENIEHVKGDLLDFNFCKEITQGQHCVFHLAGIKASMQISKTMLASHFVPTLMMNTNILEACRINESEKIVYTSSIGAYSNADIFKETPINSFDGPPLDFAGWSKRMGELQVYAYNQQYNLDNFAIVRPSAIYGPGDNFDPRSAMVVPSLMAKIHNSPSEPLEIWGDGTAVRDIAFSRDIAEGVILALYHGTEANYINLGSGRGCSIKELVETLSTFLDFKYTFDTSKPSGASQKILNIEKAQTQLGYTPQTSLKEGLEETWEWFTQNLEEFKLRKNYFHFSKA